MYSKRTILIVGLLLSQYAVLAQQPGRRLLFGTTEYRNTDSGVIELNYQRVGCKNYVVTQIRTEEENDCLDCTTADKIPATKTRLFTVHGNIAYDYFYRSGLDSPFRQQAMAQHTERLWLDITYKERYPFRIGFTARQGNNSFLRDFAGMNMNFDKTNFIRLKKEKLYALVDSMDLNAAILEKTDSAIAMEQRRIRSLGELTASPYLLQKIVEERERQSMRKLQKMPGKPGMDSLNLQVIEPDLSFDHKFKKEFKGLSGNGADSAEDVRIARVDTSFKKYLDEKNKELEESRQKLGRLVKIADSLKTLSKMKKAGFRNEITKASTATELNKLEEKYQPGHTTKRSENFLSHINTIGLGRNLVDYTELTAKDIILTGINVEYQYRLYAAFAAGKIDYGFRDFFGREYIKKDQYLVMGRLGKLNNRGEGVIVSLFKGRKNSYPDTRFPDTVNNYTNILGYSLEMILKKTKNAFLSAEVAKSTKYFAASDSLSDKANNLFKIGDASNMGVNIKGHYIINKGETMISGFFRKTGERYQSFSLFTFNTKQQAWQVRLDHSMYKGRLALTGTVKQNDYTNLLTNRTFKSSTIFKSIVANIRIPGYPVLSVGYYPGSQFFVVDKNTVTENAYYILNASAFYNYTAGDVQFSSTAIYNRFFNKATDSGFIAYQGINTILSQTMLYKKLQLMGGLSFNNQPEIHYYTAEAGADYELLKFFRLGGSLKYNKVNKGEKYTGYITRLSASINNKAGIQLSYERSYIPAVSETLFPVRTGRVSVFKTF